MGNGPDMPEEMKNKFPTVFDETRKGDKVYKRMGEFDAEEREKWRRAREMSREMSEKIAASLKNESLDAEEREEWRLAVERAKQVMASLALRLTRLVPCLGA